MGRRALRKVDPDLDLSAYLKVFDELPNPWDAEQLFGRPAPLEVEVGSGKGLFLVGAAAERPEHHFLGLEIAGKYARFAAARVARRGLKNAVLVAGDALRVFHELLPNESLAAVHVYFPDPWWKARHRKRRVMKESFLRDVERTLAAGGRLHFWTDVRDYFDESLESIARHTSLSGPIDVSEQPAEHDLDYRTNFERRTRLANQPVHRAMFEKAASGYRGRIA